MSGPKVADVPIPIRKPCASANWVIDVLAEAATNPQAIMSAAAMAGSM